MLNHLQHRTNQVRNLTFYREAIYRKDAMTTKDTNKDGTRSESLSGPAVNFGYETNSHAAQSAGTNAAYHVNSPEIIVPGIQALQSPIISSSGQHERSGHRVTGSCKFYLPSFRNIKNQVGTDIDAFESIETNDIFYDMEQIIMGFGGSGGRPFNKHLTEDSAQPNPNPNDSYVRAFNPNRAGTSIDRFRATIKGSDTYTPNDGTAGTIRLNAIQFHGMQSGTSQYLIWYPTGALGGSVPFGNPSGNRSGGVTLPLGDIHEPEGLMIDLPIRDVKTGDTATVYNVDGTTITFNALLTTSGWTEDLDGASSTSGQAASSYPQNGAFDLDLQYSNTDGNNRFGSVNLILDSNLGATDNDTVSFDVRDLHIYKAVEWRVDSIKDYRDEYMEINAVRVRGDRTSRRRAYG